MSVSDSKSFIINPEDFVAPDFTDSATPHDRVLVIGEHKFYVYSGHLSFCSEHFRTMFTSDFKESNQQEIELKEVDPEDFHVFLKTLTPGTTSVINDTNFMTVMACARRFMAPGAMIICTKFAMDNFESLDKLELLNFAFEYNLNNLKDKLADYLTPSYIRTCNVEAACEMWPKQGKSCSFCGQPYNLRLENDSFLLENMVNVSKLSAEIQALLFQAMVKKIVI